MKKSIFLILPAMLLSVTSCQMIKDTIDTVLDGITGALDSLGVVTKASNELLGGFTATGTMTKTITYPNPVSASNNNTNTYDATYTFRKDAHQEKLVLKGKEGEPDTEPTYATHFMTKDGFLGEEKLSVTNEIIRERVLDANFKPQAYEAVVRNPFTYTLDPTLVKEMEETSLVNKAAIVEGNADYKVVMKHYKLEGIVANKFVSAMLGVNTTGADVTLTLDPTNKWSEVEIKNAVEESIWMSQSTCAERITSINATLRIGKTQNIENTLTKHVAPEGAKELQTALDGLKKDNITLTLYNDKAKPAESKTFEFTFTKDKILASFMPGMVGESGYQDSDMLIVKQKDGTAKMYMYGNVDTTGKNPTMGWVWDEYLMLKEGTNFDDMLPKFGGVKADIFNKIDMSYVSAPEVTKTIGSHFLTSVVEQLGFASYDDFRIMCNEATISLKSGGVQTIWLEANHTQPGMNYHGSIGLLVSKNGTSKLPEAVLPETPAPTK